MTPLPPFWPLTSKMLQYSGFPPKVFVASIARAFDVRLRMHLFVPEKFDGIHKGHAARGARELFSLRKMGFDQMLFESVATHDGLRADRAAKLGRSAVFEEIVLLHFARIDAFPAFVA